MKIRTGVVPLVFFVISGAENFEYSKEQLDSKVEFQDRKRPNLEHSADF